MQSSTSQNVNESYDDLNATSVIQPQALFFRADSKIPNNPSLPVLVYRKVLDPNTADKDRVFKKHFEKSGWCGMWTGFIFDYHHFHTNTHEALAIAKGHVRVMIGGDAGKELDLQAGDLIVLPVGTGHKMVTSSENLVVVGAYPPGQKDYNICKSVTECPDAQEEISNLALPENDPFYGVPEPLRSFWKN